MKKLISLEERNEVFFMACKNVNSVKKSIEALKRYINIAIRNSDEPSLASLTKMYAVLYCCYSESLILKISHTPRGFSLSEINQIRESNSVTKKWKKCIELATRLLPSSSIADITVKPNHAHNARKTLVQMVEDWIEGPTEQRNRLAHGQFQIAFNNGVTKKNDDITKKIESLDAVKIETSIIAMEKLSHIIEDIIESPNKAHFRDYWKDLSQLEYDLNKRQYFTVESKRAQLLRKKYSQN